MLCGEKRPWHRAGSSTARAARARRCAGWRCVRAAGAGACRAGGAAPLPARQMRAAAAAAGRDIRLRKRQAGIPLGQPLPLPGVEPGSTRAGDMQLLLNCPLACERFFRRGEHGVRLGRAERKAAVRAPACAEHFAQALRPAGGRLLCGGHRVRRGGGRPALAVIAAAADAGRSAAVLPAVCPG